MRTEIIDEEDVMKETHTNANGLDWKAADGYPEGAKIKVLHEAVSGMDA